jgi:hypothetical protein
VLWLAALWQLPLCVLQADDPPVSEPPVVDVVVTGNRAPEEINQHRPTALLRFHRDDWGTSARVRGSAQLGRVYFGDGEQDAAEGDGDKRIDAPALVTGDLRIEQTLGKQLELFAGVDNLLGAGDLYTALRPRTYYAGLSGHY